MELKEMEYVEKLRKFNYTPKYKHEFEFLSSLIKLRKGKILDYGCGTGDVVIKLKIEKSNCTIDGYDIKKHDERFDYVDSPLRFYNVVLFMHSLAHIIDPGAALIEQRKWMLGSARIIVITPNKDWLDSNKKKNYIPDPTVVNHFCAYRLEELFKKSGFNIINSGQFGERIGPYNERLFLVAEKNKYWHSYGR